MTDDELMADCAELAELIGAEASDRASILTRFAHEQQAVGKRRGLERAAEIIETMDIPQIALLTSKEQLRLFTSLLQAANACRIEAKKGTL